MGLAMTQLVGFGANYSRFRPAIPFSAVKLLLGFEGANNATTTTDESNSANTMTMNGGGSNAKISTAQFKFGSSSCVFDGSGDEVYCQQTSPTPNDFDFGSGAFCFEAWVRFATSGATVGSIGGQWGAASPSWFLYLTGGNLRFRYAQTGGAGNVDVQSAWAPAQNTWYHVCADKDASNKVRTYIDGVMQASQTIATAMQSHSGSGSRMGLGLIPDFAGFADLNGYLDEVRCIKGYTPYGSDAGFTPPTTAFSRSSV